MAYYLRIDKTKKKNDLYIQIYESKWDANLGRTKSSCFKSIGYASKLITKEITNPIIYWKRQVEIMNNEKKTKNKETILDNRQIIKNVGYSLIKWLIDKMNISQLLQTLNITFSTSFDIANLISNLIYARLIKPCSKIKTIEEVIPMIYGSDQITKQEVYQGVELIGSEYTKIIELFNISYKELYGRNTSNVFFDCTNYYFEIDVAKDDKQKGPSKEKSSNPIIGQALLLDADQIPLTMKMFPGNKCEKPYLREIIDELKTANNITGRTIQVADKGLNCAANIHFALENGDGYVFSKSVNGKNLTELEKQWIIEQNDWKNVLDNNGNLLFKVKEKIEKVNYKFIDQNSQKITFDVNEKRVVSYNPHLAKKKQIEIQKMWDKALRLTTNKACTKAEYGSCAKYVDFESKDKDGNEIKIQPKLNYEIYQKDMTMAGYNLIVTSELKNSGQQIYEIYHGLWKIEESFKVLKSFLDARPIYLQKKESIYGHFLICYLALFLLRVLEIKEFKNKLNSFEIINFIKEFNVCEVNSSRFINCAKTNSIKQIYEIIRLNEIINVELSKKDLEKILNHKI